MRHFLFALICVCAAGFGIPGPQGAASGGTFTGGTLTSDLVMGDNDILGANVIQPTSGETLVLNDEGGAPAATITTAGDLELAGSLRVGANSIIVTDGANQIRLEATEVELLGGDDLHMPDDGAVRLGAIVGGDMAVQGETTTLTDGSATTVLTVQTGDGDMVGLVIDYTIQSTDGAEYQSEMGTVRIAIVDDAGGVVSSESGSHTDTSVQAVSSGTLTSAWTTVTTDDGNIEVQLNADTSLTPSTHQVRWKATWNGADATITVP